ncbi:MAG: arsenate reductase ArsC [Candidatus Micrarchaeota archaeon]
MKRIIKKIVLFICVHNSARSQMAQAIYNSKSRRSYAKSAGSKPGEKVSTMALAALAEIDVHPINPVPKKLTQEMVDEAFRIFTMGCKEECPTTEKFVADWGLPEPIPGNMESYRKLRDLIVQKVKKLLKEVEKK